MSSPVIKVENLSKQYRIGERESYKTFREAIAKLAKAPFTKWNRTNIQSEIRNPTLETIWALKDVSFEVKPGEVVGIIGKNGAGKSTLLKILSKITEPTEGRIELRGRVGSLLEIGTGFHPELTGHENIYLYGAILGMDRWEVARKFDEIVAFSELEKFIDTPVKRYSSGMYMRLAFAVAAHLEPEIFLVDEVLAVGDSAFQKKCLGKMGDVSNDGRTVMFVSHQLAAVQHLCPRAILLSSGKAVADANTDKIIHQYMNSLNDCSIDSLSRREDRNGNGDVRFVSIELQNEKREKVNTFFSGDYAILKLNYKNRTHRDLKNFHFALGIDDRMGARLFVLSSEIVGQNFPVLNSDNGSIEVHIPRLPLMPGTYGFTIYSTLNGVVSDWIKNAGFFEVEAGDFFCTGRLPLENQGHVLIEHHFQIPE